MKANKRIKEINNKTKRTQQENIGKSKESERRNKESKGNQQEKK